MGETERSYILCGLGHVGWRVLECLHAAGLPVVVIDQSHAADDPRLNRARLVRGDCRERRVLAEAGVDRALGVLILCSDDLVNISAMLMVRHLNPDVRVVVRLFNQNLVGQLQKLIKNVFALSTSTLTAPLIAMTALTGQALGGFQVDRVRPDVQEPPGPRAYQLAELVVAAGAPPDGRTIGSVAGRAGPSAGGEPVVLAHLAAGGKDHLLLDVDPDAVLRAGDRLVLCGEPHRLAGVLAGTGHDTAVGVKWAGWVRRTVRIVRRTFREIDAPVKAVTLVFVLVVSLSTAVLVLGDPHFDPALAFNRTISVMATSSDMKVREIDPAWEKVFVSGLRVIGAVLTAVVTAIFTNYLIRARLATALEVRRVPERGHIIVCGMGNVGYRVVDELLSRKQPVVVIEQDKDNRFVPVVRKRGAAVILGDATLTEVFKQANPLTAQAVVVATPNDLINIEVALMAREARAGQRAVVRLNDTSLAETLREAADIRHALSVSALAAPAFVAALYGDHVQKVVLIAGRALAVVDLHIHPGETAFLDQPARAVAVDYGVLPVTVLDREGVPARVPLNARLSAGSRLIGIARLTDLERLLRREPVPREWGVEVTSFPLPMREWLMMFVRQTRSATAEQAATLVATTPFFVHDGLTRGQAAEVLAKLARERISAVLKKTEPSPPDAPAALLPLSSADIRIPPA